MSRMVVTLPLPGRLLSPNARCHWRRKAAAVRARRRDAGYAMLAAVREQKPAGLPWRAAMVETLFLFADRRHRDKDNLLASIKPDFDSIQDAKIVADDSRLTPAAPVIGVDASDPRLVMTITELP